MRALVLGASGMAGHVMTIYLRNLGYEVDTLANRHRFDEETQLIDVTNAPSLDRALASDKYDVVVNCIGLLMQQSEERKDLAVYINSYLPHLLEERYKETGTRVVHISTDDVFSYRNPPYDEKAACDGASFYGRSKALGELINNKDLTFRTSIVGPSMRSDGTGLFNWFWAQTGEISGYINVIWNGVTTIELAKATVAALEQNIAGVYHLAPQNGISKFDLLQLFIAAFDRKDLRLKANKSRSSNKTLSSTRKDFNYRVPDYQSMVEDMKSWIDKYPDIYKHYGAK